MWITSVRKKKMAVLFFGCVGVYAARIVMPNSSIAISQELEFNKQQMGFVLAIFFWGYISSQYVGGYLSDRLGGELVISVASMFWSLITLIFVWIPSFSSDKDMAYGVFLLFRFFFGFFQGFYFPSLISLMTYKVDSTLRQSTYSFIVSGNHIGSLLCGSIGSYLLETYNWRVPFHLIGTIWFLWSLIFFLNLDTFKRIQNLKNHLLTSKYDNKKPVFSTKIEDINTHVILEIQNSKNTHNFHHYKPLDWSMLLRSSAFWSIVLANFSHSNIFFILFHWLPTYFHDNFKDSRSWIFNLVPWVIMFPSVLLSGYLADFLVNKKKFPVLFVRKFMNTIDLLASSFFLFFLTFTEEYYLALTFASLAVASCGFHTCGAILSPQDIAPSHGGQVYGFVSTIATLPGFFGVYFAGYILETTHQWNNVFNMTIAINFIGWFAFTFYGTAQPIV